MHDHDEGGANAVRESLEELLKGLYTACGCSNTDNLERVLTIHLKILAAHLTGDGDRRRRLRSVIGT